jgi:hypothetical protein
MNSSQVRGVISGSTQERFASQLNHKLYCENKYDYVFDVKPRPLSSPYDHKLFSILDLPIDDQWWFWIDDDAFFMQAQRPLEELIADAGQSTQFVFARSPVNSEGGWTSISSGNFFFRSSRLVHDFLKDALETSLEEVSAWWRAEEFGMFTNGDQDKILYQLYSNTEVLNKTNIIEWDRFNFRPYHFKFSSDEHFLVHFAGNSIPKEQAILDFMKQFSFSDTSLTEKLIQTGK